MASMSPTTGLTSTRLGGGEGGGGGRWPVVRNAITAVFMLSDSEPVRLCVLDYFTHKILYEILFNCSCNYHTRSGLRRLPSYFCRDGA